MAADAAPRRGRQRHDLAERGERLLDPHVDVVPGKGFRCRGKDGDLARPGPEGPLHPLAVGHQGGEDRALDSLKAPEHLFRVRHLGDPVRTHECARLDHRAPGRGEPHDELHPHVHRHDRGFVLKSVARPDLDHSNPARRSVQGIHGALPPAPSAGDISTTTVPPSIWSPERTLIARIRPPSEALMTCSIFIASMITSGCPTVTESPTPASTCVTRPGMGATRPAPDARGAPRRPPDATRYSSVCPSSWRYQRSPCRATVAIAKWSPTRTRSAPAPSGLRCTRCAPPPARTTTPSPSRSTSQVTARSPRWSVSSPTARAHPPPSNPFPRVLECLGLTARRNAARVPTGAGDEDRGVLLAQRRDGGRDRDDLIGDRGTPP